jgi:integrase
METTKLNLGKVVWHDESYEDKETGKRVNPYPGVVHLISTSHLPKGKEQEKIYYVVYRDPKGDQHREKVGRQFRDRMTPAKAAGIREARIKGDELPNKERREVKKAEKKAADARWDFSRLFEAYTTARGDYPRKVTDAGNYRVHLAPVVAKKTPAEITGFDVDRIKRDMKKPRQVTLPSRKPGGKDRVVTKGECKPGTIAAALGFLVRLSSFAVKRNLTEGIKFAVELPRDGSARIESMTPKQMTAYLAAAAACENKVIGAALRFELLTGVRLGEARDLIWDDLDFQRGTIHLREPKGGKDQFIPMTQAAADLLNELDRDPENLFVFQGVKDKKGKRKRSGRFGVSTAARRGREFADAAGLPRSFRANHGLRHSYASALASSGEVDLYTLQKLMTHKSPTMTQRYAHLRDETLRRGADVMSRIVSSAVTVGQEKAETA